MSDAPKPAATIADKEREDDFAKRRNAVRLTTVFSGRISQFGKAYACTISDVSAGGAKIKIKNPRDYTKLIQEQQVQLVFERLSDYKALNGEIAWLRPDEQVVGMTFSDPELRRRVVLKRLMPNRWRIVNEQVARETTNTPAFEENE